MKKRVSKDLIFFIILIPLFLWASFQISSSIGNQLPSYSVINKSKDGFSVFYETLKELKYPVNRSLKALPSENEKTIQITVSGSGFNVNDIKVRNWIGAGGTLIYLTNEKHPNIEYKVTPKVQGSVLLYKYQKGMLAVANADGLTNIKLTEDRHNAYELLEIIDKYRDRNIYFNEAHLYMDTGSTSLWDALPAEYKYVAYQLLMVLAAYFYYRSKRFGKPVPLYEEVERTENEYLYSAASLYRASGAWDLMLDNYYKSFLKTINLSDDDWVGYWECEKLPDLDKARNVYDFIHRNGTGVRTKEYIQAVSTLDRLKSILEKRRESYWKTLKKTL